MVVGSKEPISAAIWGTIIFPTHTRTHVGRLIGFLRTVEKYVVSAIDKRFSRKNRYTSQVTSSIKKRVAEKNPIYSLIKTF